MAPNGFRLILIYFSFLSFFGEVTKYGGCFSATDLLHDPSVNDSIWQAGLSVEKDADGQGILFHQKVVPHGSEKSF